MNKNHKKRWIYTFFAIIFISIFIYYQNNSIVTTEYTVESNRLPQNFDRYKIVQLTDLHNKSFGKDQSRLVSRIEKIQPHVIFFTGDLIDSNRYNEEPSFTLMKNLVRIAPVYYVTGNHEWRSGNIESLSTYLSEIGVNVLRNSSIDIIEGTEKIQIIGVDDPAHVEETYEEYTRLETNIIDSMSESDNDSFRILLSHRPEFFSLYTKYELDLIFSGHAHGGQFRIPFFGGIIAPNQGLFPEYTSGLHKTENTSMIVNRGLGNSIVPIRIFNRPEIVVVTLFSSK